MKLLLTLDEEKFEQYTAKIRELLDGYIYQIRDELENVPHLKETKLLKVLNTFIGQHVYLNIPIGLSIVFFVS